MVAELAGIGLYIKIGLYFAVTMSIIMARDGKVKDPYVMIFVTLSCVIAWLPIVIVAVLSLVADFTKHIDSS